MKERQVLLLTLVVCGGMIAGCNRTQDQPAQQTSEQGGGQPQEPATSAQPEQASAAAPAAAQSQAAPVTPAPPPPPPPRQATLPAGTVISVRTATALTTETTATGERFTATLERPLADGAWVIAARGATVEGVVAESNKGGRVKGRALLSVRLSSLTTADGQTIPIDTRLVTKEARATKKKDVAKIGIGSGVGAAIGAIAGGGKGAAVGAAAGGAGGGGVVLATRGDAAEIPPESVIRFELRAPVLITERR
ncbi:MAG: hypothetical protein KIT09_27210 [Bryobacteraceae bacterium]|nr:hypothetical protein [Bryobacteraceae bacterium]